MIFQRGQPPFRSSLESREVNMGSRHSWNPWWTWDYSSLNGFLTYFNHEDIGYGDFLWCYGILWWLFIGFKGFVWNLVGFDVQNPCWLTISSGIILPKILGIITIQERRIPFLNQPGLNGMTFRGLFHTAQMGYSNMGSQNLLPSDWGNNQSINRLQGT